MKTLCSLMLCGAILHATTLQAQTNEPPIQPQGTFIILFVLTCVAAGGYIIFRVSKTVPNQDAQITLILDKSSDGRATWTPIFTNTVVLHGHDPLEFFRDQMTDDLAFYRARLQK
jgi:hypothetical protein